MVDPETNSTPSALPSPNGILGFSSPSTTSFRPLGPPRVYTATRPMAVFLKASSSVLFLLPSFLFHCKQAEKFRRPRIEKLILYTPYL